MTSLIPDKGKNFPLFELLPGFFPPGVKLLRFGLYYSPFSVAEVKNVWRCISIPPSSSCHGAEKKILQLGVRKSSGDTPDCGFMFVFNNLITSTWCCIWIVNNVNSISHAVIYVRITDSNFFKSAFVTVFERFCYQRPFPNRLFWTSN
jgi:hypothetical protein